MAINGTPIKNLPLGVSGADLQRSWHPWPVQCHQRSPHPVCLGLFRPGETCERFVSFVQKAWLKWLKSLKIPLKSMKIRCWMIICIHLSYENLTFGYFWHQTWYHILATAVFSGYLLFVAVTHGNATLGLDWSLLTYLGFTGCQIETQKPVNESSLVCHQTATIRITKSKVQDWASRRNLKSKASRCKHLETQGFLSTHIQYIQYMLSSQDSSSGRFGLDKRLVFEVSVACLY